MQFHALGQAGTVFHSLCMLFSCLIVSTFKKNFIHYKSYASVFIGVGAEGDPFQPFPKGHLSWNRYVLFGLCNVDEASLLPFSAFKHTL